VKKFNGGQTYVVDDVHSWRPSTISYWSWMTDQSEYPAQQKNQN